MLTFSVVFWRGRDTANKYRWHVWGVLAVDGPHCVCHSPRRCVLPVSTLLRLQDALQGHTPKWALHFVHCPGQSHSGLGCSARAQTQIGCGFCVFPRSKLLKKPGTWWAHCRWWTMHFMHLLGSSHLFPWFPMRAKSQVSCVSPLGRWSQAVTLLAHMNCSGSQEDMASNWQLAHSLVEDAVSVAKIAAVPCLLELAVAHQPLYLWGGRTLNGSWLALLWYSLGTHNTLFC